jgi:hypothetical protein
MFSDDYGDDLPEWAVNKSEQVRQFRTRNGGYDIPDNWIEGNPNRAQPRTQRPRRPPDPEVAAMERRLRAGFWNDMAILAGILLALGAIWLLAH